jgi:hypothetical protein
LQLTKNMQALVGGMVNGGLIDADDLLEDWLCIVGKWEWKDGSPMGTVQRLN